LRGGGRRDRPRRVRQLARARHLPAHAPPRARGSGPGGARRAPRHAPADTPRGSPDRGARRPAARDRDRAAMTGTRRFWELTWMLAVTDWRLRFYGSALGYAWTLARPFAFFGVIYIVFTEIADIGNDIKDYGICILFSMVLFQFFGEATNGSVTAIVRRENLLRKMRFPRLAIPLSTILTALMNLVA